MKKRILGLFLTLTLTLSSCASPVRSDEGLHILCTTYPLYLFTTAVTEGVDGVEVTLLVNSQTSCLHDYTLTVADMKAIEGADVIVMNGAGLEDFMSNPLAQSHASVIDCSEDMELLPALEHEGHEHHEEVNRPAGAREAGLGRHEEEFDPHYWMDPHRAGQMVEHIADGLAALEAGSAEAYLANASNALNALSQVDPWYRDMVFPAHPLITFHDGFQYFAAAEGFDLLRAIEEEDGATVSAAEIKELVSLIESEHIPAIFVERNGSRSAAKVLSRETGCAVYELDMLMSGDGRGIQPYLDAMDANLKSVLTAFSEDARKEAGPS